MESSLVMSWPSAESRLQLLVFRASARWRRWASGRARPPGAVSATPATTTRPIRSAVPWSTTATRSTRSDPPSPACVPSATSPSTLHRAPTPTAPTTASAWIFRPVSAERTMSLPQPPLLKPFFSVPGLCAVAVQAGPCANSACQTGYTCNTYADICCPTTTAFGRLKPGHYNKRPSYGRPLHSYMPRTLLRYTSHHAPLSYPGHYAVAI